MKDKYYSFNEFIMDLCPDIVDQNLKIAIMGAIHADFDGVGRVIDNQAKQLSKKSDVTIFTLESYIEPPDEVKLYVMGVPNIFWLNRIYRLLMPFNPFVLWKYVRLLKDYDIIIAHQYPLSALAYMSKKFYGIKYIYWHYHHNPEEFQKNLYKIYMKLIEYLDEKSFLVKSADIVASISDYSRNLLGEGIHSIVVYPDIKKYFTLCTDGNTIRNKYNLNKDPIILYVGRISPQKNIEELLKVHKIVKNSISSVKLLLVGKPVFKDYYNKIKATADDAVIFTGYVSDEEVQYFYTACDVYASCSLSEGYNLPLAEAQSMGKEVVVYDIGAHGEVVHNGYLIQKGNTIDFADKIVEVIKRVHK